MKINAKFSIARGGCVAFTAVVAFSLGWNSASADELRERPVQVVPLTRTPPKKSPPKKRPPRLRRAPGAAPPVPAIAPERPSMSAAEFSPLVVDYQIHMNQLVQQLQAQVAEAKTVGEPVRLNCLLDKYFQAKNYKNAADRAMARFNAALMDKNETSGFRHFGDVAAARQGVEHFAELASTCASSPSHQSLTTDSGKGSGSGSGSEDPGFLPTSPTVAPTYPVPDRPPNASPFI